MTNYIFIPSFPSVFFALYYNTFNNAETIVITSNPSVKHFTMDAGIQTLFYKGNRKPYFQFIVKKRINNLLKQISYNSNLFLLDNAFVIDGFYLAANWNKGTVYFKNLSTNYPLHKEKIPLSDFIGKKIIELSYHIKLINRKLSNKTILGIDEHFISSHNIKKLEIPLDYSVIKSKVVNNNQLKIKKCKNLWIDQGNIDTKTKDKGVTKILNNIIFNHSFAIKEHPKHISKFDFKTNYKYPTYIPAEFLLSNVTNAVVSVYSLSLIEASSYTKAISILELIDWRDEIFKTNIKTMFTKKSKNSILFPTTITELEDLLL